MKPDEDTDLIVLGHYYIPNNDIIDLHNDFITAKLTGNG